MEAKSLAQIGAHIDKKDFYNLYVFCGEEDYLINLYVNRIIAENCVNDLNRQNISKEGFSPKKLAEAYLSCPIEGGKRVIAVYSSGVFAPKKSADSGQDEVTPKTKGKKKTGVKGGITIEECLEQIPDTAIVIFSEKTADKRLSAYKCAEKIGFCAELKKPDAKMLASWAVREAKAAGAVLSASDAAYFIDNCGENMYDYANELKKLAAYAEGGNIKRQDIDEICFKTLQSSIFAFTDSVGERNIASALARLDDLLKCHKNRPKLLIKSVFVLFLHLIL